MVVHQPAYLRPGTPPPVGRRPPYASGRCAVWRLACGGRGAAGLPGAHICSGVRRTGRTILPARAFVRANLCFCGCSINCACACTIGYSRMVLRCRSPLARRPLDALLPQTRHHTNGHPYRGPGGRDVASRAPRRQQTTVFDRCLLFDPAELVRRSADSPVSEPGQRQRRQRCNDPTRAATQQSRSHHEATTPVRFWPARPRRATPGRRAGSFGNFAGSLPVASAARG